MVILAMLLAGVYGFWYLTNDARIRRQARRYLQRITGAHVSIERADFRLFGPIRLHGVRVAIPGERMRESFFAAKLLVLRHRPWSVFITGRVHPTEIICQEPTVKIEHDQDTDRYNFQRLFAGRLPTWSPGGGGVLPPIRVLRCRHRPVEIVAGVRLPGETMVWNIVMVPKGSTYRVRVEEDRRDGKTPTKIRATIDLTTGGITDYTVSGTVPGVARALPRKWRMWRETYKITGEVRLKGRGGVLASGEPLELKLWDVALELPKEQGALKLTNVRGTLAFTFGHDSAAGDGPKGAVELRNITGRVVQAGGARFKLSGKYHGYAPSDPFDVKVKIENMAVPFGSDHPGLSGFLDTIHRWYRPVGRADVSIQFHRGSASPYVTMTGTIDPRGMSATYKYLPYRLDNLSGAIRFTNSYFTAKDIKGTRDGGRFTINAEVALKPDGDPSHYNVVVKADSALLDDALRDSLPAEAREAWGQLNPRGRASARVVVSRKADEESDRVRIDVIAEGDTQVTYADVPYPLHSIRGTAHIEGDRWWVPHDQPLVARGRGRMKCEIYGEIRSPGTAKARVHVTVKAKDLPLDEALAAALPREAGEVLEALGPTGAFRRVSVEVRQRLGEELTYAIKARLEGAGIKYKGFPYAVTDMVGNVFIEPGVVRIEEMSGRHGKTPVRVTGRILMGRNGVGLDLGIHGTRVVLDREFYEVLWPELKLLWDTLRPRGMADIHMRLRSKPGDREGQLDYRMEILPQGMTVVYKGFPYEFRGVTGRVVATPGRVELEYLTCTQGKMSAKLSGVILTEGPRAVLSVQACGVPIDARLLRAVPDNLKLLVKDVEPTGTLDLDLESLEIDMSSAKGRSTTAPGHKIPVRWKATGALWLHGATVDVAFGAKKITGKLSGSAVRRDEGLAIDVAVAMDKVMVQKRVLTNLKGRVIKKAGSSSVQVENLTALAYGGRLGGREMVIRLSDPVRYSFRLWYEDIKLGGLVNAGIEDPQKRSSVKGRMAGRFSLEATAGQVKSRLASGEVIISQGELYEMPILLGLMHVLYLSLPGDTAFTEGYLKYRVEGRTMIFEEIFLDGSAMSLVGSGTMDMKSELLNLTFLSGPPGRIPRLRGLSQVMGFMLKELLEIRVTGTLAKPIRTTVPLRSLEAMLKELLSPARKKKR